MSTTAPKSRWAETTTRLGPYYHNVGERTGLPIDLEYPIGPISEAASSPIGFLFFFSFFFSSSSQSQHVANVRA